MNLEDALFRVAELEVQGELRNKNEAQNEISKVLSAFSGRVDLLDQDDGESDEDFYRRILPILPTVLKVIREKKSQAPNTTLNLAFFYMDAGLLLDKVPDKWGFVLAWLLWLQLEEPSVVALWHKDSDLRSQYLDLFMDEATEETKKTIADTLVENAKRSSNASEREIIFNFAKQVFPVETPSNTNSNIALSSVRDRIGPELLDYLQSQAPAILDEEYLFTYFYMSKDLDFSNSSRILFTSHHATFIPSKRGAKLFRSSESIRTTPLSSFQSCDIGDAHNAFSYGFTGQSDSYFFDFYWTMSNGNVFTTRSYAGSDLATAKTFFNRTIKPMATSLGDYIEFTTDGGHIESQSGSNLRISYGVWF